MSHLATGREFRAFLAKCPPEQLELPAHVLLDEFNRPRCDDCGQVHLTPWAAFACDDFTDARRRRDIRRWLRAQGRPGAEQFDPDELDELAM